MNLFDYVDKTELEQAIEGGLVNIRESGDGMEIYNYSKSAQITSGAWDIEAVRKCRGIIVHSETKDILARAWEKFFNYGQLDPSTLDHFASVEVTDKMDGSLGIIHVDAAGHLRVATRGSFHSEQALWATEWISSPENQHKFDREALIHNILRGVTYLVEIIYPGSTVVVQYGDTEELVLLGSVLIDSGVYRGPDQTAEGVWFGEITDTFQYTTLTEALAAPPRPNREGLCVRFLGEPTIVKVKQEDYIRLHRIVTGLSRKSVWERWASDLSLEDFMAPLPDELHSWVREVDQEISDAVETIEASLHEQVASIQASLGEGYTQKDFALEVRALDYPYKDLIFLVHSGRSPLPGILKILRKNFRGDTSPRPDIDS